MIHLAGPVVLAAALAGAGVYGLVARRNAVLVLIGAELLLNAVNVLAVTASYLPAGGLSALAGPGQAAATAAGAAPYDPMIPGQVLPIVVITIAAAEIGLALAVILLVFRQRATSDLSALRELGEASPSYDEAPDAGELPERQPAPVSTGPPVPAGAQAGEHTS
ncbi:MAG TPA: NADH-quinone oxidoreductase subunit K [Kineosporiaceae bacterium]|nr:NADH-quinone oxidoreductase subunit K [Kineosporiaceae bacterium]